MYTHTIHTTSARQSGIRARPGAGAHRSRGWPVSRRLRTQIALRIRCEAFERPVCPCVNLV